MAIPAFALVLSMLAAGHLAARLDAFPPNAADTLNRFVLYVCMPALVLVLVPGMHVSPELAVLVALPWLLLAISIALVLLASRRFGWSREVTGALLLCIPLGNTSFLGFPLLSALLGEDSIRLALVYDQLGSFLMLATWGLVVLARYAGQGEPSLAAMATRVLRFPPFLALVLGLLPIPWPPEAITVLRRIGDALVPTAMFAVGLKLELRLPREKGPLAFGLVAKMGVLPLVAWGLTRALHADPAIVQVAVLESGVPAMISAGALAIMAGLAPELAAGLVGFGILLSMITVPLWAALVR